MNTNLLHNILNLVIALAAALTAFMVATGCIQLSAGDLECSASWIDPAWAGAVASGLAMVKILINVVRSGLAGLYKPQPPIEAAGRK